MRYRFNPYCVCVVGFGFLSFEDDDAVDRCVAEHFVNLNGKQVPYYIIYVQTCITYVFVAYRWRSKKQNHETDLVAIKWEELIRLRPGAHLKPLWA